MQQQTTLSFSDAELERVLELTPDATGRCSECGHGRLVELETPEGNAVPGAGKWIRCALREPGHFHAPSSMCLLEPPRFFPRVAP